MTRATSTLALATLAVLASGLVVTPSFDQEVGCLPSRVGVVTIVEREPLYRDGRECGSLYTFEFVETLRGAGGRMTAFGNEDNFAPESGEYFVAAFRWEHNPSLEDTSCFDMEMNPVTCDPPELEPARTCLGRRADWAMIGRQRLFKLIELPENTGIPGRWVLEERESILTAPEYIRTVLVPPAEGSITLRRAVAFDDLARWVRSLPDTTCPVD